MSRLPVGKFAIHGQFSEEILGWNMFRIEDVGFHETDFWVQVPASLFSGVGWYPALKWTSAVWPEIPNHPRADWAEVASVSQLALPFVEINLYLSRRYSRDRRQREMLWLIPHKRRR